MDYSKSLETKSADLLRGLGIVAKEISATKLVESAAAFDAAMQKSFMRWNDECDTLDAALRAHLLPDSKLNDGLVLRDETAYAAMSASAQKCGYDSADVVAAGQAVKLISDFEARCPSAAAKLRSCAKLRASKQRVRKIGAFDWAVAKLRGFKPTDGDSIP